MGVSAGCGGRTEYALPVLAVTTAAEGVLQDGVVLAVLGSLALSVICAQVAIGILLRTGGHDALVTICDNCCYSAGITNQSELKQHRAVLGNMLCREISDRSVACTI